MRSPETPSGHSHSRSCALDGGTMLPRPTSFNLFALIFDHLIEQAFELKRVLECELFRFFFWASLKLASAHRQLLRELFDGEHFPVRGHGCPCIVAFRR